MISLTSFVFLIEFIRRLVTLPHIIIKIILHILLGHLKHWSAQAEGPCHNSHVNKRGAAGANISMYSLRVKPSTKSKKSYVKRVAPWIAIIIMLTAWRPTPPPRRRPH